MSQRSGPRSVAADGAPRLVANPLADRRAPLGEAELAGYDPAVAAEARDALRTWSSYKPTPLVNLSGLARSLAVRSVHAKYEGARTELQSFKALGGAYALSVVIAAKLNELGVARPVSAGDLEEGRYRSLTSKLTTVCASDGNHGRSLAWGARRFGCAAIVYLPRSVSPYRAEIIERYGARVVWVDGNYDDAVHKAASDASRNGWLLVADTGSPDYWEIPRLVMAGYSLLMDEAFQQLGAERPTHIVAQVGCGGLAGVVSGYLRADLLGSRPVVVGVEPLAAACLLKTVEEQRLTSVGGSHQTVMGGLACGEVSYNGWLVLREGIDFVLALPDRYALTAVRALATGELGTKLIAAESGAAGIGALMALGMNDGMRRSLGLDGETRILVIVTEGATDPDQYARILRD